jgi:hypothetical protein
LTRSSNDGPPSASYRGLALRTARKRGEGRSSREVSAPGSSFAPTIGFPVLAVSDGPQPSETVKPSGEDVEIAYAGYVVARLRKDVGQSVSPETGACKGRLSSR